MRRALVIVGKAPEPGLTKTRLMPWLSADEAAELYRAFLLDTVELGLQLGWERACVVHPRGDGRALRSMLPGRAALLEQPADGLGEALAFAFEHHFAAGFQRVVLIGSDNPTLRRAPIEQACAALETHDLSIGPSVDGGYYLIALRRAHPGIFEGIDWSTPRVYAQTLGRARQLGLRVHAVPEWYDIDAPADLERLQRELRSASDAVAPHTRAALGVLAAG